MREVVLKPEPSKKDHDDTHQNLKKGKKKAGSRFASTRRYARIPLKIVAALATVYVCMLSSERYLNCWVQTSIERADMHVSQIKFPAVSIFPVNFTSLNKSTKSHRFARAYNLAQSVFWQTPISARLTDDNFTEFPEFDDLSLLTWGDPDNWKLNCRNFFSECQWRRKAMNCCDLFRPGKSFKAFAFEFNSVLSLGRDETWPWSVAASGALSGLNVKIKRQHSHFNLNMVGVFVHEPTQYMGMSVDYSSEDRIVIPVEPLHFTAEIEVKTLPLEKRRCYLEDEVLLTEQSRSECIHRCHIKYIIRKCNCTLNLPVKADIKENITDAKDSSSRRNCGIKDLSCFNNNRFSLFSTSNIIEESRDNVFSTVDCGCFPRCDRTQYHSTTYTERLSTHTSHATEIEIDVYFQEETLFSYRSMLGFTLIDLMVSYGGIAGLIMGISVLGCFNNFLDHFACCRLPHDS
ncbi:pickpocket protein 19-like [Drosophila rhopaloa]|uniref:Pickpocket protein 19-like n=1 Tax=Drosophila rhopaloa TaxID=1041015 RepID=A0A6P4FGG6_DRORH|nr:pickpocket protein 19-like [Drosophila rhopaloa]